MHPTLFGPDSRLPLRAGVSVLGAAERSRRAAVAFLNGVSEGWGAEDLVAWLSGPYRAATHSSEDVEPVPGVESFTRTREIEAKLRVTRERVLELVEQLANLPARLPFIDWAIERRLVVPCESAEETGWIAVGMREAGLSNAVAALFVADYLLRPADYRHLMSVCPSCGAVLFDTGARMRGNCGLHAEPPPESGPRLIAAVAQRRKTLTGLGGYGVEMR